MSEIWPNIKSRLKSYFDTLYLNSPSLVTPALGIPDSGNLINCTGFPGKNRIINGAMTIDQRNNGAEVTPSGTGDYTLDRFKYGCSVASKIKIQRVAVAPSGFVNSMKLTVAAQYSPATSDYFIMEQRIEGLNIVDFAWGTASALPVTLSFWVKGSVAGTYSGSITNADATRSYPFSFPVTTSWVEQVITIPGCTDGVWNNTTGIGISARFNLGSGSTFLGTSGSWQAANLIASTGTTQFVNQAVGSTLNITGLQLEKGSVATEFEFRHYGAELALCQRYYEVLSSLRIVGYTLAGYNITHTFYWQVAKRAIPTVVLSSGSYNNASNLEVINPGIGAGGIVFIATANGNAQVADWILTGSSEL